MAIPHQIPYRRCKVPSYLISSFISIQSGTGAGSPRSAHDAKPAAVNEAFINAFRNTV